MHVVIVGSGLIGVTSAYFLAQRGAHVTVLERAGSLAQGASQANSGLLTPSWSNPWNTPGVWRDLLRWIGRDEAPFLLRPSALPSLVGWGLEFLRHSAPERYRQNLRSNLQLASYSLAVLRELRARLGLTYAQSSAGTLRIFRSAKRLEDAASHWRALADSGLAVRMLSREQTVALEPALADARELIAGGIHCPGDESGDARLFTEQLAAHAQADGVQFRFDTTVTGFELEGARIRAVATASGPVAADAVVVSAGSWSAPLLQRLNLRLPVRPVKGYSITLDASAWSRKPGLPVIDDALHAAVTPLGTQLRVAGTAELAGHDTSLPPARIENLYSLLLAIYPSFAPRLDRARAQPWAGLRPVSADGVPFIGRLRYDNLYLNTGHGHLGWTLAAGSGCLLADLMLNKTPAIDPAAYAADRR